MHEPCRPPDHLAVLLSCHRATEEAEKTTTTYLDNGTHPAQGEVLPSSAPCLGPILCPSLGHLTIYLSVSPTRLGTARFRLISVSLKPTCRCSEARAERVCVSG